MYLDELRGLGEESLLCGLPQSVHLPQHPQAVEGVEAVGADLGTVVDLWVLAEGWQGVSQSHLQTSERVQEGSRDRHAASGYLVEAKRRARYRFLGKTSCSPALTRLLF